MSPHFTPMDNLVCDAAGWAAHGLSERGYVRTRNEDRFSLDGASAGYVLCDGMGGHPGGAEAATVACRAAADALLAPVGCDGHGAVDAAVAAAVAAVADAAAADRALAEMGTTLTLVWLGAGDDRAWYGHVGDSRLYRAAGAGLIRVTEDHTVAAELMRAGGIDEAAARQSISWHRLTRVIGAGAPHDPDIGWFALADTSAIVLCSDGISNMIDDGEIADLLARYADDPGLACHQLVAAALAAGGHDNATAIVLMPARDD